MAPAASAPATVGAVVGIVAGIVAGCVSGLPSGPAPTARSAVVDHRTTYPTTSRPMPAATAVPDRPFRGVRPPVAPFVFVLFELLCRTLILLTLMPPRSHRPPVPRADGLTPYSPPSPSRCDCMDTR